MNRRQVLTLMAHILQYQLDFYDENGQGYELHDQSTSHVRRSEIHTIKTLRY
jgi:hypothetical protein